MNTRIAVIAVALCISPTVSQARWLSPNTGRFQTMDTYEGSRGEPQTLHKYVYCQNNPVNGVDPSGKAVYFVTRKFAGSGVGGAIASGTLGHGYLLITADDDPGAGNPFKGGRRILGSFSWHPSDFTYSQERGPVRNEVPGRVWERHPDDMQPQSAKAHLVTNNRAEQLAVLQAIGTWIVRPDVGYDVGAPIPDRAIPGNFVGHPHRAATGDPVYYSLMEQNCVWWAAIMLKQSGVAIPQKAMDSLTEYNLTGGAADRVISGQRKATTAHTMSQSWSTLLGDRARLILPGYTIYLGSAL